MLSVSGSVVSICNSNSVFNFERDDSLGDVNFGYDIDCLSVLLLLIDVVEIIQVGEVVFLLRVAVGVLVRLKGAMHSALLRLELDHIACFYALILIVLLDSVQDLHHVANQGLVDTNLVSEIV